MNWYLYGLSKLLFLCTNRSVSKVHDEWFADEEKVRKEVGVLDKPVIEYLNAREVSIPCLVCRISTLASWKLVMLKSYYCFDAL